MLLPDMEMVVPKDGETCGYIRRCGKKHQISIGRDHDLTLYYLDEHPSQPNVFLLQIVAHRWLFISASPALRAGLGMLGRDAFV